MTCSDTAWTLKISLSIYQMNLLISFSLYILPFILFYHFLSIENFLVMPHKTIALTSYLFSSYNLTQFWLVCFSLPWKPFPWCIMCFVFLTLPHLLLSANPSVTFTAIFFSLSSPIYLTASSTPSRVDAAFRFMPSSFPTAHYPWSSADLQFFTYHFYGNGLQWCHIML